MFQYGNFLLANKHKKDILFKKNDFLLKPSNQYYFSFIKIIDFYWIVELELYSNNLI